MVTRLSPSPEKLSGVTLMMAIRCVRPPSSSVRVRSCQRYIGRAAKDMGAIVDIFQGSIVNGVLAIFAGNQLLQSGPQQELLT